MAIAAVVTRGFGGFGSIAAIVTRGYAAAAAAVEEQAAGPAPSGAGSAGSGIDRHERDRLTGAPARRAEGRARSLERPRDAAREAARALRAAERTARELVGLEEAGKLIEARLALVEAVSANVGAAAGSLAPAAGKVRAEPANELVWREFAAALGQARARILRDDDELVTVLLAG